MLSVSNWMINLKQILIETDEIQAYIFLSCFSGCFLRLILVDGNVVELVRAFNDDHHHRKLSLKRQIRFWKLFVSDHEFSDSIKRAEHFEFPTKFHKARFSLHIIREFFEVPEDFLFILSMSI